MVFVLSLETPDQLADEWLPPHYMLVCNLEEAGAATASARRASLTSTLLSHNHSLHTQQDADELTHTHTHIAKAYETQPQVHY